MLQQENLAANFCGLLSRHCNYKRLAVEWRILGQEQDGSMLASWISECDGGERSSIGIYNPTEKSFRILIEFPTRMNCIQATVNASRTLLSYTVKDVRESESRSAEESVYFPWLAEVKAEHCEPLCLMADGSKRQIMTQFLWQKKAAFERNFEDKMLLFVHDESISMLKVKIKKNADSDCEEIDWKHEHSWLLDRSLVTRETIVKHFIWAQFDANVQALYYIHLKPVAKSSLEKDDMESLMTTTLSAHQFHENLPRETVVRLRERPSFPSNSQSPAFSAEHSPESAEHSTQLVSARLRRRRRSTAHPRLHAESDHCDGRVGHVVRVPLLRLPADQPAD